MQGNRTLRHKIPSSPLVIGLDLGTSSVKAIAYRPDGSIGTTQSQSYPVHTPRPGWMEQNPDDIWEATQSVLSKVIEEISPQIPAGLCISGAMHNVFPIDQNNLPLARAQLWADTRAGETCKKLRNIFDPKQIYMRVGCPLQYIYHPARLHWWNQNTQLLSKPPQKYISLKEWVVYKLTGQWACDIGWASTTGFLNHRTMNWDEEILEKLGFTPQHLCQISPSLVRLPIAPNTIAGLRQPIQLILGSSDGALANLGSGAFQPGARVITVGTSGAVRLFTKEPWLDDMQRTWCYTVEGSIWFAGGAINNAGLALDWVRKQWYPEFTQQDGYYQLLQDAVNTLSDPNLLFLPYLTGERSPVWRSDITATLTGLRYDHTRAQIALAALESTAFCLKSIWDILPINVSNLVPTRITGAITASPIWLQIIADVLQQPLLTIQAADSSAIGAAILGYHAMYGIPLSELCSHVPTGAIIYPRQNFRQYYADKYQNFQDFQQKIFAK